MPPRPFFTSLLLHLQTVPALARTGDWVIADGHLTVDGQRTFLKFAKPLRNFSDPAAVDRLIADLYRILTFIKPLAIASADVQ